MFKSLFRFKQKPTFAKITPAELQQRLGDKEPLVILDVRSAAEYRGNGHIAGSKLIPLPELHQQINKVPQNKAIVCVCQSGNRSGQACKQLIEAGFTDVSNLSGGMLAWKRANLPIK